MALKNKENYLKTFFLNADVNGFLPLSVLSKKMGVSVPTANSMVKSLHELGWVKYQKYKPLQITEQGRKEAALIIRKHRIAEKFLVENMNLGWEHVHDIAEEMEHINSDILFDRMDEMLDYPTVDPHGSPIPDENGNLKPVRAMPLSTFAAGQKVKLCSIYDSSSEFLVFLNKKEITLGTEFDILEKEPFDESVTVTYAGHQAETFSKLIGERLCVKIS